MFTLSGVSRPLRIVLVSFLVIVGSSPTVAVDASNPPPFCQGRTVDDGLGHDLCDPSYDNGSSDDLDLLVTGNTNSGSLTVTPSIAACSGQSGLGFTPDPCYSRVDFSFGSGLKCAYVDSYDRGTSRQPRFPSLSRPCEFSPSDHLGLLFGNYIYKVIGFSTEPGYDLGLLRDYGETGRGDGEICRSRFNRLYANGAPGETWEPVLTCDFPLSTPLQVEGLLGPTWIAADARLTVEEMTSDGPISRSERATGWIPVSGTERARTPIAEADAEQEGTGPENCNNVRFTNDSISQYGASMTYKWEIVMASEVGGEYEPWATSVAREPVIKFPPSVAAQATLTVTSANGLSDSDTAVRRLRLECGEPDDPPPGGDGSVVVIEATDGDAAEEGSNKGTWTLTRTDDELDALVVAVSLSGSATEGADFAPLPDTVSFPQGAAEASVELMPIRDSRVEPDETVTMTIEPGAGYTVGDPNSAEITIINADASSDPMSLVPLVPARLLETRAGEVTADGEFEAAGRLAAGSVTPVQIAGRGGVDQGADAVALNVTAIGPGGSGFVTLFPCDAAQPTTSSLNFQGGGVAGNSGIVKLSAEGRVCVFTQVDTDLVLDVNAWLPETPGFASLVSARLAETRDGEKTVDGKAAGMGRLAAGSVTPVQIAGRGGVDVDADAVAVNVTAILPAGVGYVTLYPCDEERPTTSSLNHAAEGAVGNSAVVSLAADGTLCVFTFADTDLVLDVNAWLVDDASFDPLVPARFFETRDGQETVDGESNGVGRVGVKSVTPIQIAGRGGVPLGASAAALNVTAVRPGGVGFITLFPCDGDQPLTSSLNYSAGGAVGNSGVVKLAADGTVCAYTQADTDLVIDVNAAWTA